MWGSTAFAAGARVSPVVVTPLDVEGALHGVVRFAAFPLRHRSTLGIPMHSTAHVFSLRPASHLVALERVTAFV
jgi:hypothetical protein